MIIVYHPTGAALTTYALNQWLASALALVPSGPASEIVTTTSPGVILELGLPDYPLQVETAYLANDRETQGGITYSRLHATRRQGTLNFSNIDSAVVPDWRAWYSATAGFRLPFIVQLPDLTAFAAVAPGNFPLSLVKIERWQGSIQLVERL